MTAPSDPIERFRDILSEARQQYPDEFNAMTVSTVGADGRPSSRVVLLKAADEHGFVFYTNLESRKGRELAAHPWAALCFWWPRLERQVRIEGKIERVSDGEADAYFASRPRGSQVGAWASRQSEVLNARIDLEQAVEQLEKEYFNSNVPRPPFWTGLRVVPDRIEFWKNKMSRLHDREVYTRQSAGEPWRIQLLYP